MELKNSKETKKERNKEREGIDGEIKRKERTQYVSQENRVSGFRQQLMCNSELMKEAEWHIAGAKLPFAAITHPMAHGGQMESMASVRETDRDPNSNLPRDPICQRHAISKLYGPDNKFVTLVYSVTTLAQYCKSFVLSRLV